jgi:hypothetical protein
MTTLILTDGTRVSNLEVNGDNFISSTELTPDIFENNLSPVIIDDEDGRHPHEHMELVQITHPDDNWWFVLRDLTQDELDRLKIRSDIDFIAMMSDIDLEEM